MVTLVNTRYGSFETERNSHNSVAVLHNGARVKILDNVRWWDRDGIVSAIERNIDSVRDAISESVRISLSRAENTRVDSNAADIIKTLQRAKEAVLRGVGNAKHKTYVASMLDECIGKLGGQ